MKKKAAALAVGALFAAPAVQAQITMGNETIGTVQIYGKLYPQFGIAKGQGSTQVGDSVSTLASNTGIYTATNAGATFVAAEGRVPDHLNRNFIDSQNSYLGFRGERNLGGKLKAIWQIEQSVELDTGTGTFSSRNSFAGLSHGVLGTVKLGKMDSIYKEYGDTFAMFGISSGNFISASNVLSNGGIGSSSASRFHERYNNTIQYQTAEFGGFQAGIQYMPDEARGNPARGINAHIWSYGVKYDSQLFYVSLHQEQKWDFFGASTNIPAGDTIANSTSASGNTRSRDVATRLSGELRFSGQRIVGDIARLHYNETGQTATGRFMEYKKTNWAIGYDINVGAWGFATQYIRAGSGTCELTGGVDCSTTGMQSSMWTLGTRYRFDRQTFLYLIGARLQNGPSAAMSNLANFTANRGEDTKAAAVGISYSF